MTTKNIATARSLSDDRTFTIKGRNAWALLELVKAGPKGVTPIDVPGPRWSAYVHTLKRDYGLAIETLYEPHLGNFPGTHARYILRSPLQVVSRSDQPERTPT